MLSEVTNFAKWNYNLKQERFTQMKPQRLAEVVEHVKMGVSGQNECAPSFKYMREEATAHALIFTHFSLPPVATCSRAQCPLFLVLLFLLVLRSTPGAHALIKNELAPLPLVYLKWMRAAVGAYLSPPDFHGTLWRTGRAKMQNFSSSPPHRLRRASIALLTLRWAAPTTFCTSSIKRNGRDIFHRPGTGG